MINNTDITEMIYNDINYVKIIIDPIKYINIDAIIDKYDEDAPKDDSDYLYD